MNEEQVKANWDVLSNTLFGIACKRHAAKGNYKIMKTAPCMIGDDEY